MYFIYLFRNRQTQELYFGYTNNLERRLKEHNNLYHQRKLIYYEAYNSENDARERETQLKRYGQARAHLKKRIKSSLQV